MTNQPKDKTHNNREGYTGPGGVEIHYDWCTGQPPGAKVRDGVTYVGKLVEPDRRPFVPTDPKTVSKGELESFKVAKDYTGSTDADGLARFLDQGILKVKGLRPGPWYIEASSPGWSAGIKLAIQDASTTIVWFRRPRPKGRTTAPGVEWDCE